MNIREKLLRLGVGSLVFIPQLSQAACSNSSEQGTGLNAVSSGGPDVCTTTGANSLPGRVGSIIDIFFIVAGAIGVLIMIIGGIRYITSTGDSKRIQAAKDTILYAVLGLIVVILARAIVGYVIAQVAT
jgi:hypothetical protein